MSTPIKRHPALQPLSRDHHHGLLLCWKIREGFKKNIPPERIKRYAEYFYETHLVHHFQMEEKHIFPIIGSDHQLVKEALAQHKSLHNLFSTTDQIPATLHAIEKELEQHIRFEERVLFNEIQEAATPLQLQQLESLHLALPVCEDWDDEFWK